MKHLYPLPEEEFYELHRKAWENGWTYGPGFDELYVDYSLNFQHFKNYIDELITNINNRNNSNLNILIGEAPPFWTGNSKSEDRTYFYNPEHTKPKQTWLTVPYNHFVKGKSGYNDIKNKTDKQKRLNELSVKGVLLIDVFPFPIWQDPNVRNAVSNGFSKHIENYFLEHIINVLEYIQTETNGTKLNILFGLMAPEYTSLQLMYGINTSKLILKCLNPWGLNPLKKTVAISRTSFKTGSGNGILPKESKKAKFLYRIINDQLWHKGDKIEVVTNMLEKIPILMSEGGSPNFDNYCNSSQVNLIRLLRQQ